MRRGRPVEGQATHRRRAENAGWPPGWQIANEAGWDRVLRAVLGLTLLFLGWSGMVEGLPGALLKIFGPLPLVTGLVGWDPIYAIFGWSTLRRGGR